MSQGHTHSNFHFLTERKVQGPPQLAHSYKEVAQTGIHFLTGGYKREEDEEATPAPPKKWGPSKSDRPHRRCDSTNARCVLQGTHYSS